jgi:bifunctional UDP-N-acetylglucosamine pyrophosphorylase/glucosamine-1-phosphate N-acetyltransferase
MATALLPLSVVILAAGKGKRMQSAWPKVMHPVAGLPMINHVLRSAAALQPQQIVVVIGPEMPTVQQAVLPWPSVIQSEQLGTGHAVQIGISKLPLDKPQDILILYGDCPLITSETLRRLRQCLQEATTKNVGIVVLGMRLANPTGYGRMMTENGILKEIVEERDASVQQKTVNLCNAGIMLVQGQLLPKLLGKLRPTNAQSEYYLTDIVRLAAESGQKTLVLETDPEEVMGVNTRSELALVTKAMQKRLRCQAMDQGVSLVDPETVWLSWDTLFARDVIIHPYVNIGLGVKIAEGVEIRSFSSIEGATIGAFSKIGPFARLRPGTVLDEHVHIGNFVEIKNSEIAEMTKINHLSYIGDANVGKSVNIGAGTITCNYDGMQKYKTIIEDHSFIGSNTSLVAPVVIGEGAMVGAGSVITTDVPAKAMAVGRAPQVTKADGAVRYQLKKRVVTKNQEKK